MIINRSPVYGQSMAFKGAKEKADLLYAIKHYSESQLLRSVSVLKMFNGITEAEIDSVEIKQAATKKVADAVFPDSTKQALDLAIEILKRPFQKKA